ncbi:hypothetical protein UlMin_001475 [Ulmus minor]
MALKLVKEILVQPRFVWRSLLGFRLASAIKGTALVSINRRELILSRSFWMPAVVGVCCKQYLCSSAQHFSTDNVPERLCWEGSSHALLLKKLQMALECHRVEEAWESFFNFKKLHGFPENSLVHRLITELSYSSDPHWLRKACDFVFLILKEKSDVLQPDILTKLSLSLARSQLPTPAAMILRLMLEKGILPSMDVLWLIVMHMVKTEVGTHLASNFLVQICERSELLKPDTMLFNLVLDACVRCKLFFKGQQIIEWMAQTGVVADAHSIIIIAQIHEMNDQRDELKKYKVHIDQVLAQFTCHYRQFYNSLLSLHFKFNDIAAAAELVWDICGFQDSVPVERDIKNPRKTFLVPIGSHNLKTGMKIQIQPELLQRDTVLKVESKQELVTLKNGRLALTNRALAKLIIGFERNKNITELSKLLLRIQEALCSLRGSNLCSDVIDAFIHLDRLETAHDILDDMEAARAPIVSAYMSLLTAYCKQKMLGEAKALLKQMNKAGLAMDISDEMVANVCQSKVVDSSPLYTRAKSLISISDLVESFLQEKRVEEENPPTIYELNSSIYYFCKAKMIEDAMRTYIKMEQLKIQPTVQTYAYLVSGYSSMGMYRDITFLWGDIKRSMESGNLVVSRELFEFLLINFLRGGYFERVMEVSSHMKKHSMFTDKWMYRSEFLKLHKNLYKSLKASEARTEAQENRLRYVLSFRKWVGID